MLDGWFWRDFQLLAYKGWATVASRGLKKIFLCQNPPGGGLPFYGQIRTTHNTKKLSSVVAITSKTNAILYVFSRNPPTSHTHTYTHTHTHTHKP